MDKEIENRLVLLEEKIDSIYRSVESIKNYFKWTLIITLVVVLLPAVGLIFAIPKYLETLQTISGI